MFVQGKNFVQNWQRGPCTTLLTSEIFPCNYHEQSYEHKKWIVDSYYKFVFEKEYDHFLDRTWFPFTQGCFVPDLVVLEKKIFDVIFHIITLISIGKGLEHSIELTRIPLSQECFMPIQVYLKLANMVLEKKIFICWQHLFAILLISPIWKRY